MALRQGYEQVAVRIPARVAWLTQAMALVVIAIVTLLTARQTINHMSYRTDSSLLNRRFLTELRMAIPVVPEDSQLYVYGAPRDLSLFQDDGFYLIPAIQLWYGRRLDVRVGETVDGEPPTNATIYRWRK